MTYATSSSIQGFLPSDYNNTENYVIDFRFNDSSTKKQIIIPLNNSIILNTKYDTSLASEDCLKKEWSSHDEDVFWDFL